MVDSIVTILLLVALGSVLGFLVWVLWNFSAEIRAGRRRQVRRTAYDPSASIYGHPPVTLRFRRGNDKEAA